MSDFFEKMSKRTEEKRLRTLSSMPNVVQAGQIDRLKKILTNYHFMLMKIDEPSLGVEALISDYELIEDDVLLTIGRAIRRCSYLLSDSAQLGGQLVVLLRPYVHDYPEIETLFDTICMGDPHQRSMLIPISNTFTSATGALIRTLSKHTDAVLDIALTADGSKLVSGGLDAFAHIWDVDNGRVLDSYDHRKMKVSGLAINGNEIYLGTYNRVGVFTWDLDNYQTRDPFPDYYHQTNSIALTPDKQYLIAASLAKDGTIQIWETRTKAPIAKMTGHIKGTHKVITTHDSQHIVTSGQDGTVRVWSINTCQEIQKFELTRRDIYDICLTADSKTLFAVSGEKVFVINLTTGKTIKQFGLIRPTSKRSRNPYLAPIYSFMNTLSIIKQLLLRRQPELNTLLKRIVLSPDEKYVLVGSQSGQLRIWHAKSGKRIITMTAHSDAINTLIFTPDGNYLITCSNDRTIKIWDFEKILADEVEANEERNITQLRLTSDERFLISTSYNVYSGDLKIWDWDYGKSLEKPRRQIPNYAEQFIITPDNSTIITAQINYLNFWNLSYSYQFDDLPRQLRKILLSYKVDWSFASKSEKLQPTRENHMSFYVKAMALSHDGRYFALACSDPTMGLSEIIIYDAHTYTEIKRFIGHDESPISSVFFVNGEDKLVSVGVNDETIIWDVHTGNIIRTIKASASYATLTPDNRYLLGGTRIGKLYAIDFETAQVLQLKDAHTDRITSIRVAPSGNYCVTTSQDMTVKVWGMWDDLPHLATFTNDSPLLSSVITQDGTKIAVSSKTGQIHVLSLLNDNVGTSELVLDFSEDKTVLEQGYETVRNFIGLNT